MDKNTWSNFTVALKPDVKHLKFKISILKTQNKYLHSLSMSSWYNWILSTLGLRQQSCSLLKVLCSSQVQRRGQCADSAFRQTKITSALWSYLNLAGHPSYMKIWPDVLVQCLTIVLHRYYTCSYQHFIVLWDKRQYTTVSSTTSINVYTNNFLMLSLPLEHMKT